MVGITGVGNAFAIPCRQDPKPLRFLSERLGNEVRQLEYKIPEGSDAVKEVAKCVRYCKEALA